MVHRKIEGFENDLHKLPDEERELIEWRYGLNGKEKKTLKQLAEMMGLSMEGVRKREMKALDKLIPTYYYNPALRAF